MSSNPDWSSATWEGSRRAQIRRDLRLTVRERLEALEALTETSERLARTAHEVPTESAAEAARSVAPDSAAPDG
jgi:hypothetical protein